MHASLALRDCVGIYSSNERHCCSCQGDAAPRRSSCIPCIPAPTSCPAAADIMRDTRCSSAPRSHAFRARNRKGTEKERTYTTRHEVATSPSCRTTSWLNPISSRTVTGTVPVLRCMPLPHCSCALCVPVTRTTPFLRSNGKSALYYGVKYGHLDVVRLCLSAGEKLKQKHW